VTAVLELPATAAVNCRVCETVREDAVGVSETVTGERLMMALADLVESAVLVAVTVTFCALAMEAGAV